MEEIANKVGPEKSQTSQHMIANEFRQRAVAFKSRANRVLFTMGAILIGAVSLIVLADIFTKTQPSESERAKIAFNKSQKISEMILDRMSKTAENLSPSISEFERQHHADSLIMNDSALIKLTTRNVLLDVLKEEDNYVTNFSSSNKQHRGAPRPDFNFISPIFSRIAFVVLFVFVLHFLLKIYRYNIKMSSFYLSRADTIDFYNTDGGLNLSMIVKIFSTDNIELGEPQIPYDKLLELMTESKSNCCCCCNCAESNDKS